MIKLTKTELESSTVKEFSYADTKGILLTRHSYISKNSPVSYVGEVLSNRAAHVINKLNEDYVFRSKYGLSSVETVGDFLDLDKRIRLLRSCGPKVLCELANVQNVFHDITEREAEDVGKTGGGACSVNIILSANIQFASVAEANAFIKSHKALLGMDEDGNLALYGEKYHGHIYTQRHEKPVA